MCGPFQIGSDVYAEELKLLTFSTAVRSICMLSIYNLAETRKQEALVIEFTWSN